MREDGDGPRASIDLVVLAASKHLSKVWYEKGWVEGNSSPPDCWSGNGITPDPSAPNLQSPTCASCPRNIWGGRITENGKRAKECTDSKRLAVVPVNDIANEAWGGPMLLRVPAASLSSLASYGAEMSKMGFPYYSIATRISFDPQESYPKFKFMAVRPLDLEEGAQVLELKESPLVDRILAETGETVIEGVAPAAAPAVKQIAKPAPKPAPASKVMPRKAAPASKPAEEVEDAEVVEEPAAAVETAAAAEEEAEEDGEAFDKALDAKLAAFLKK
jgi:hypothetical protein